MRSRVAPNPAHAADGPTATAPLRAGKGTTLGQATEQERQNHDMHKVARWTSG